MMVRIVLCDEIDPRSFSLVSLCFRVTLLTQKRKQSRAVQARAVVSQAALCRCCTGSRYKAMRLAFGCCNWKHARSREKASSKKSSTYVAVLRSTTKMTHGRISTHIVRMHVVNSLCRCVISGDQFRPAMASKLGRSGDVGWRCSRPLLCSLSAFIPAAATTWSPQHSVPIAILHSDA